MNIPLKGLSSANRVEMRPAQSELTFRQCKNCKSRANPDVQCPLSATRDDYCSRHYKNPKPFVKPPVSVARAYTRNDRLATTKIQAFWRRWAPLKRFTSQGPAANCLEISMNDTELYTFEPIRAIPSHYIVSIADERHCIWVFDVRTLVHSMTKGYPSQNPYTRDAFLDGAKEKIHGRIEWLRRRRYPILHINTDVVTSEQIWKHRVLDTFLRIESLGYYVNCDWFYKLSLDNHKQFYVTLFSLWEWKLQLTPADKERILPIDGTQVFRFHPNDMPTKTYSWWQKNTLGLIDTFISKGCTKEDKKMGGMYSLMALVAVSSEAAEALHWLA